jgi:site-specific recombinase XerD
VPPSAASSLEYLCEKNAVDFNPVKGAKRPKVESNEGSTPALRDHQARALLDAPDPTTLKGKRDRALVSALVSVLLYPRPAPRALCQLKVRDIRARRGVLLLRAHGKGNKLRYLPLHTGSAERIHAYLEVAGHGDQPNAPLFQPARRHHHAALTADDGLYKIVLAYAAGTRIEVQGFGVHSLRATAATNALEHEAGIAKVQEWLGYANIATTRIYDRRKNRPEDSPTFRVN